MEVLIADLYLTRDCVNGIKINE